MNLQNLFSFFKTKQAPDEVDVTDDLITIGGVLETNLQADPQISLLDNHDEIPDEILWNHSPKQELTPLDEKYQILSAGAIANGVGSLNQNQLMRPHRYYNPHQDLDLRIYEALYKNTFLGSLVDSFGRIVTGAGFEPELKLIHPSNDQKKNRDAIEGGQEIINKLVMIDRKINKSKTGEGLGISFETLVQMLVSNIVGYGRGAILYHYDKHPIQIDDTPYPQIPTSLSFVGARDLGMITCDPQTSKLQKVQYRYMGGEGISVDQMLYGWNIGTSAKVWNSQYYGFSMLANCVPAAKVVRQLISDAFPIMITEAWSSLYLLIADNEGGTIENRRKEYQAITRSLQPGKPGVLIRDPKKTDVHKLDLNPQIEEFQKLYESLINTAVSSLGLPSAIFDGSAPNRSTLIELMQYTKATVIEPLRRWLGDLIVSQWYQKHFEILYANSPELEKFEIVLSWNDLPLINQVEMIEAALALDMRPNARLKDDEFGNKIADPQYSTRIVRGENTVSDNTANKNSVNNVDNKGADERNRNVRKRNRVGEGHD